MSFTFNNKKLLYVILCLFIIGIGVRSAKVYNMNKPFIVNMNYDKNLGKAKYYSKEEGYVFKYSKASFFNNDSFASVCKEDDVRSYMDKNGNIYTKGMQIILFIWPNENKYGLDFYQYDKNSEISEQIYVDRNMNFIYNGVDEEYESYINGLLNLYEDEIQELSREAQRKWNQS